MKQVKIFDTTHNKEIDEKFHQLNIGNIGNVIYWWEFLQAISDIQGDIVECGIGRARSLIILSALNYFRTDRSGGEEISLHMIALKGFLSQQKKMNHQESLRKANGQDPQVVNMSTQKNLLS